MFRRSLYAGIRINMKHPAHKILAKFASKKIKPSTNERPYVKTTY